VEAYFGGGQVLFARDPKDERYWWDGLTSDGRKADGVSEVVNDLNGDLMNFYGALKDPELFDRLRHRLELTLFSEAEWRAARDRPAAPDGDPVVRAADLFTLCRQSLAGRMDTFAPTTRTRLRGGRNGDVNAWWKAVEGLHAVHERLRDVKVLSRPALDVIRQEDTPATFFYLDPPYVPGTRASPDVYGEYEMSEEGHRQLLALLLTVKAKVILSGYPSQLYDDTLGGWSRHSFDKPNNAAGGQAKRRMSEVLWWNF
jgi:DNA adenine methylase